MARSDGVVQFIRGTACADTPDAELVERFVAGRDEQAFRALVARYGPTVWAVCRKVLRDHHAAEDAFQATLVVFARRAGTLRAGAAVGGWLHAVAYRVAARLRGTRRVEAGASEPVDERPGALADLTVREAEAALHAELAALPERYRAPLVLCSLEGLSRDEAAERLGWPANRVKHGLERGRELLRSRLARRGLAFGIPLLLNLLGQNGGAVPPAELVGAAIGYATGAAPPSAVAALVNGVTRTMWIAKWKLPVAACSGLALAVGILAATLRDGRAPSATVNRSQTVPADAPENTAPKPEPAATQEEQPKQPWDVAAHFLQLSIDGKVEEALKVGGYSSLTGLQLAAAEERVRSVKRSGLTRARLVAILMNDTRVAVVTERTRLNNAVGDAPDDAHVAVVIRRERTILPWKSIDWGCESEKNILNYVDSFIPKRPPVISWAIGFDDDHTLKIDTHSRAPWDVASEFLGLVLAGKTAGALKLTVPRSISENKVGDIKERWAGRTAVVAVLLNDNQIDVVYERRGVRITRTETVYACPVVTLAKLEDGGWRVNDINWRDGEQLDDRVKLYLSGRYDAPPKK